MADLEKLRSDVADRAVVAAITHDHARIWLLNETESAPLARLDRDSESPHRHVWAAQSHHMHGSETTEPTYFGDLESLLAAASRVILVGHGKGKGNEVDRFLGHLARVRSPLLARVVGTGVANLPAMTDAQVISAARERWSTDYL